MVTSVKPTGQNSVNAWINVSRINVSGKTVGDHLTLFLTLSLTLNLTLTLFLTLNLTLNVTVIGLGGLPRFCQCIQQDTASKEQK